jgi:hypothetical protein
MNAMFSGFAILSQRPFALSTNSYFIANMNKELRFSNPSSALRAPSPHSLFWKEPE